MLLMKGFKKKNIKYVMISLVLIPILIIYYSIPGTADGTRVRVAEVSNSTLNPNPLKSVHPFASPLNIKFYVDSDVIVFNPSLLPITSTRFLAVGREQEGRFKHTIQNKNVEFIKSTMVKCFMGYNKTQDEFQCESPPTEMTFYTPLEKAGNRYVNDSHKFKWDQFVGAEDGRLFWGPDMKPAMIFGMNTENDRRSRSLWLIGVESDLKQHELGRELSDLGTVEKNWVAFVLDGSLYFQIHITPRKLYRWNGVGKELSKIPINPDELKTCLTHHSIPFNDFHQSTNMLKLVLCNYGECVPNNQNTILIQLVHLMEFNGIRYSPVLLTWDVTTLKLKSVSSHFHYPGIEEKTMVFATGWNYLITNNSEYEPDLGFLDSKILLSIGVKDVLGKALVIESKMFLSGSHACSS